MTTLDIQVVNALRDVLGDAPAALHEPEFDGRELAYLRECVESTLVSSVGPFVAQFENQLRDYSRAGNAVAVNSGTSALHTCLLLSGVKGGDEVLVQSLSFVATANAISYCGAHPHFVDVSEVDLGLDPVALRRHLREVAVQRNGATVNRVTGRRISAIIVMHTFGHIGQIEEVMRVAQDFELPVVEDAAEALGSTRGGRHAGTFAPCGAVSFNGNKIVTTGGGGALLVRDPEMAERARLLTTTARVPHEWEIDHSEVAYNYRMPNLNAAVGVAQMHRIDAKVSAKRRLFAEYQNAFGGMSGVQLLSEPLNCRSNYWLQTLVLDAAHAKWRNQILVGTNGAGFQTRPVWRPLSDIAPYRSATRASLTATDSLAGRLINLPSSPGLVGRIN